MATYSNDLFDDLDFSEFEMDEENFDIDELCVDDESIEEPAGVFIHVKWMLDGADTLGEAIDMAQSYIDYLQTLQNDGYVLMDTIEDGNGFALAPENV